MVCAGRRFGKTFLAKYELVNAALSAPKQHVWYVLNSYRAAKELMWVPLKEFVPASYIKSKNETELSMTLVNGSVIKLKGADNPDALRGSSLDFVVFDEADFFGASSSKGSGAYCWEVIRPALADKHGKALWITTPKGMGFFYNLMMANKDKEGWSYRHYTTEDGGNVPKEELEAAKADMDPRMYRQEFLASYEVLSGRVYFSFDRQENVKDLSESISLVDKNKGIPIHIGCDFNINPTVAVCGPVIGREWHIISVITITNGNTELLATEIQNRFPGRTIICYPDPTGSARKTSAEYGITDFLILQKHKFQVIAPGHAYEMRTKINTTNAALCNAEGKRRVFLHNKGTYDLQKSLDGLVYVEGTNIPDKSTGIDHWADALAYGCGILFPILPGMQRIPVTGA